MEHAQAAEEIEQVFYCCGVDACSFLHDRIFFRSIGCCSVENDARIFSFQSERRFYPTLWLLLDDNLTQLNRGAWVARNKSTMTMCVLTRSDMECTICCHMELEK
jgi:hypothetical protein